MPAIRVNLKEAEKAKKELIQKNLLDKTRKIKKEDNHIYFPITSEAAEELRKKYEIINISLEEKKKTGLSLKEALKKALPKEIIEKVKTSYDVVGTIAILEIDPEIRPYEKKIGEVLLKNNKKIKTVLAKDDTHKGVFRTQKMRLLAGINTREAIHKENNVIMKINVEEVYFSARLSTERKRIADQVKKGEKVLVCFSGAAPYPLVISKNTEASKIIGIEINPKGHELGLENINLNKLKNITLYEGDVKKILPEVIKKEGLFDRALMPLPKSAETFLEDVIPAVKKGGIIHFYAFLHEKEFSKAHNWIKKACEEQGLECEIIKTTKCGQHAPRTYRICVDFKIK